MLETGLCLITSPLDYLVRLKRKPSSFGLAARSIHALTTPITPDSTALTDLAGIGPVTEDIINEILKTGTSNYYTSLLTG